eukprot:6782767-Ditylum_brightwellii.AAC.1
MISKIYEAISGEYQHPVNLLEEQQYQYAKKKSIVVSGFKRTRTDNAFNIRNAAAVMSRPSVTSRDV